jgi:hypothetical protein
MYVAHEPTWEWRFIKEVFHRDKLVGMQGFRTFLGSSDPRVREANVLFLSTLTPKRSEFFANDVIFLDDMPRANLNDRFCEMVKEYVGNLGGGLVVIAGRFSPKEICKRRSRTCCRSLTQCRTADARWPEFRLRSSTRLAIPVHAAWTGDVQTCLGQPQQAAVVCRGGPAQQAFALAEHPTDKCADGKGAATDHRGAAVTRGGGHRRKEEMWRCGEIWRKYYRQLVATHLPLG